ncbi:unnamed protein product [Sphenostylis stenocarpa]|uniref:Uncharacterized protein n=1 Tax=Sphenostylis stenocarpa TaxID=92480 RepID=A0AA87B8Y2_9FABA|nr:unnamed protein product [Sphenostylis stenocarpa]
MREGVEISLRDEIRLCYKGDGWRIKETGKSTKVKGYQKMGEGKGDGILVNSSETLVRLHVKYTDWAETGLVFAWQRSWGETVPLCETEPPFVLPELDDFSPTETGEPPLSKAVSWQEHVNSQVRAVNAKSQVKINKTESRNMVGSYSIDTWNKVGSNIPKISDQLLRINVIDGFRSDKVGNIIVGV